MPHRVASASAAVGDDDRPASTTILQWVVANRPACGDTGAASLTW
jgi:hypothetical protein